MVEDHKIGDLVYNEVFCSLGYITEIRIPTDVSIRMYTVYWLSSFSPIGYTYNESDIRDFKRALWLRTKESIKYVQ